MTETSPPRIEDIGELKLYQLKRFWHSIQTNNQALAHQEGHINRLLLSAIGVGLHQGLSYLYTERPTFQQFESWLKDNAVLLSDNLVQRFNHAIINAALPKVTLEKLQLIDEYPDVLDKEDLEHWQNLESCLEEKAQQLAKTSLTFEQELSLKRLMEQLIKMHEPGIPANYSTYPTITSNYPVTNKGDQ